jgi:hypothetical protein
MLAENVALGAIFTMVSLLRNHTLQRLFEPICIWDGRSPRASIC